MSQRSDKLTEKDAVVVKMLLRLGFQHKRIAALFDCNQGRISEINSGQKFADVPDLIEALKIASGWGYGQPPACVEEEIVERAIASLGERT